VPLDAIRLEAVSKRFGERVALEAVSFRVPRGAVFGVIGPNGSGKTTTLRLLLDLLRPDAGRIEVLGETRLAGVRDCIGYLPEERGLYRKMTVRGVVEYLGRLKGASAAALRPRVAAWLERMELASVAGQRVEALSKGMAQKLQLVAALIAEPELLVLDEPLSGLDPVNQETVTALLGELRAQGRTILLSTHDMGAAERLCDRIAMISRGRVVLDATLAEIQQRYATGVARVDTDAETPDLLTLPGVARVEPRGRLREVELRGPPEEFLRALAARAPVRHFELARPSLHDVFVRIARPEPPETPDA
jgi:ABC-2 type transport system ATP-binding protein